MPPGNGEAAAEAQPGGRVTLDHAEKMRRRIELSLEEFGHCFELELARLEIGIPGASMVRFKLLVRLDRQWRQIGHAGPRQIELLQARKVLQHVDALHLRTGQRYPLLRHLVR